MKFEYVLTTVPNPTDYTFFVLVGLVLLLFIILVALTSYQIGRYSELQRANLAHLKAVKLSNESLERECFYWRIINNPKAFNATKPTLTPTWCDS